MNYTLFRVWGIPIRLNVSLIVFLPILAWLIGSGEQLAAYASIINSLTPATVEAADLADTDRWIVGTAAAVGLFASVTLHELGHAWAAMRYDIKVESITLWILGGLASLSEMPKEWNQEFWIAVAGPITSILVGVVGIGALYIIPPSASLVVFAIGFLAVMNIILAVFNMVPAFPMDGGRVLRALLARDRSYVSATRIATRAGSVFAVVFMILGVLAFSPILILVAAFIYIVGKSESRTVILEELLSGLQASDLVAESEPVPIDSTVASVVTRLFAARRTDLPVLNESGDMIGAVTASALSKIEPTRYESTTVGEVAVTDLPRIDTDMSAFDALQELNRMRARVAFVEQDGVPIGLISQTDFAAVLDIRRDTVTF